MLLADSWDRWIDILPTAVVLVLFCIGRRIAHQQRTEKERRALSLVEVKGASYKQTAAALGIRMESLKMLIFRARRKIYRGVNQYLRELFQPVPAV